MSSSRDELTILNKPRMHILISIRIWSVNGRRAIYFSGQGWKARLEGGGTGGRKGQHLVNYGCVKEGTSLRRMKSSCGWLRKGLEEKDG